ncbi:MAG: HigA family addiction module antitoxin [Phascolarctobacterium sp.]|nr:HigA family addiction module antitoxin [Phascolarctobacterium sp.]
MSNIKEYNDLMAFHPGYYVAEIIDDMQMSQAEFAKRLGTTAKTISQLVNGNCAISKDLAQKLASMLGISVEAWLNLQKEYDLKVMEIKEKERIDSQICIAKLINYSFFVNVANLPKTKKWEEKVINLCKYLKVADLNLLKSRDFLVNFRSGISDTTEKNIINAQAWLQTAINLADNLRGNKYDAEKLKSYLPEIRSMTLEKPEMFMPRLHEIFEECGVTFVLLPYLKNSGINGAVRWFNDEEVLLAMNNRNTYADVFWFSLFHEIKHVFQKKHSMVFLSADKCFDLIELNQMLEYDADAFASNCLIPPKEYKEFLKNQNITRSSIKEFAQRIGIHPGIVVGRLQHDGNLGPDCYHDLRPHYKIVV